MRDRHYRVYSVRLDDKVLRDLKRIRKKSGMSWNMFIKYLISQSDDKKYEEDKNK